MLFLQNIVAVVVVVGCFSSILRFAQCHMFIRLYKHTKIVNYRLLLGNVISIEIFNPMKQLFWFGPKQWTR